LSNQAPGGIQTVTVTQVVRALRRRIGILVLCILAGGLLAAAWSTTSAARYSAVASLKLATLPDNPLTTNAAAIRPVNPATEAQVVTSSSVAERARKLLKSRLYATQLSARVTVTNPMDSHVLNIEFSATSADRAAEGANAFAQAYLNFYADVVGAQIASMDAKLAEQYDQLSSEQEAAQKQAITSSNPVTRANAQAHVTSLASVLEQVRGQRSALAGASRSAGEQVGSAQPPTTADGIGRPVRLAAGLAIGLVAGLVLALLRDRTDQRVRDREQIESELGLAVIADVPHHRFRSHRRAAADEEYAVRRLGAVVASPLNAPRISPLLVMPVREVALWDLPGRLAGAIGAHTGTALVCAADVLAHNLGVLRSSPYQPGPIPVRSFGDEGTLRAGPDLTPPSPAEVVVVDGLNITDLSTPLMLAPSCAAILLVVRRRATRLPAITATVRELKNVGAEVHGVVLLPPRPARRRPATGAHHARPLLADDPVATAPGPTGWPRPDVSESPSPPTRPQPVVHSVSGSSRPRPTDGGS
jgi:capsular polysaccharide biosynthesis protein